MALDDTDRDYLDRRIIQPLNEIRLHQERQNGSIAQALRGTELNAKAVIDAKAILDAQLKEAVKALPCVKRGEQLDGIEKTLVGLNMDTKRHEVNWGRVVTIIAGLIVFVVQAAVLSNLIESINHLTSMVKLIP